MAKNVKRYVKDVNKDRGDGAISIDDFVPTSYMLPADYRYGSSDARAVVGYHAM